MLQNTVHIHAILTKMALRSSTSVRLHAKQITGFYKVKIFQPCMTFMSVDKMAAGKDKINLVLERWHFSKTSPKEKHHGLIVQVRNINRNVAWVRSNQSWQQVPMKSRIYTQMDLSKIGETWKLTLKMLFLLPLVSIDATTPTIFTGSWLFVLFDIHVSMVASVTVARLWVALMGGG